MAATTLGWRDRSEAAGGALSRLLAGLRGRLPRRFDLFGAAALIAGAWALYANLWRFSFPSVAADEPTYSVAGWRYVHGDNAVPPLDGSTNAHNFEHPPLAKYLYGLAEVVVGHPSIPADRVVAGCCTLGAALLVGLWVGRNAGRWTGLVAGALVALLPMRVGYLQMRFTRYALLDPVAEFFMVASVVVAWRWCHRSGRVGWLWAAATGAFIGLATAAKENGLLAGVGVVLVGIVMNARHLRELARRVGQAALAGVAALFVFLASYLPLGHPMAALRFLIHFQSHQSSVGHLVGVAGRFTAHPPWWAFLWFAWHGLGGVVAVTSLVCCAAAVVMRRDRLVVWCAAALAGPLIFHMFFAGVVLPFYWVMWAPAYLALVSLGVAEITKLIRRRQYLLRVAGVASTAAAVVIFGLGPARDGVRLAAMTVEGPQRLAAVMAQDELHGPILVSGLAAWEFWDARLPAAMTHRMAADARYGTVVIGAPRCGRALDPAVRALVRINRASGALRSAYQDGEMVVYAARAALRAPTGAQIAAEPAADPASGC